MHFSLTDSLTISGTFPNEDRAGVGRTTAWVIDGATDVLAERLLPGSSDAAWFAGELDQALSSTLAGLDALNPLVSIVPTITHDLSERFAATRQRPVDRPHEKPSAAAVIVRLSGTRLEAVSLGDCSLIHLPVDGPTTARDLFRGEADRDADADVRAAAAALRDARRASRTPPQSEQRFGASVAATADEPACDVVERDPPTVDAIRPELMPLLQKNRGLMNREDGYGIFSIDPPPERFIAQASADLKPGDRLLLASDGFMRLVDVFHRYDLESLAQAIDEKGLIALFAELRRIEQDDADGSNRPRAKCHDDATAILLTIEDGRSSGIFDTSKAGKAPEKAVGKSVVPVEPDTPTP